MRNATLAIVLGSLVTIAAAGCGKDAPATQAVEPTSSGAAATPTETAPAPSGAKAVTIKHGPMTYVMDSPAGQLEKAGAAVKESNLAAELAALGIAVTIEADPGYGDKVSVLAGGAELGSTTLMALDGKDADPAELLAAVKKHLGL